MIIKFKEKKLCNRTFSIVPYFYVFIGCFIIIFPIKKAGRLPYFFMIIVNEIILLIDRYLFDKRSFYLSHRPLNNHKHYSQLSLHLLRLTQREEHGLHSIITYHFLSLSPHEREKYHLFLEKVFEHPCHKHQDNLMRQ